MGVHPDEARRRVLAELDGRAAPATGVTAASEHDAAELAALLRRLDRLSNPQRSAVLAHHLGVGAPTDPIAVEAGVAQLTVGGRELADVLAPLTALDAPRFATSTQLQRRASIGAALIIAVAALLIGIAATQRATPSARPIGSAEPDVSTSTTTGASTPTSTTTSSAPPPTWVDPDRELEIFLTDEDTIVRLEPWTRRLLWESRPFRDPQIVSIDPNSVTIDSAGNRLIVSLTDGTLLPP